MISFNEQYTRCQTQTVDSDAGTLASFKLWLNDGVRKGYKVLNAEDFYTSTTDLTADGTTSYPLPYDCEKLHSIMVTVGSTDYPVIEFPGSENQWLALKGGATTSSETDNPTYYFVKKDTYEFYPASGTDDYVITLRYKVSPKNLSAADHTTESIKTLAAAGTAVVGNTGTLWTSAMVGRYIKIDDDGIWYRITAVGSATTLTIAREYGGTAIAAGTASYTIGEMTLLPESFQDIPINYAFYMYYLQKKNATLAGAYKVSFLEGLKSLESYGSNQTTSGVLLEGNTGVVNPNDYPTGLA